MANAFKSVLSDGSSVSGIPIDSLVADTSAVKTTFNVGEYFNSSGLIVDVEAGGLAGNVVDECTITPPSTSAFIEEDVGTHNVAINYYGATTSYQILVRNGIQIKPWATATEAELAEMLEAHYAGEIDLHEAEGWEIGAEREVALSAIPAQAVDGFGFESHTAKTVKMVLMHKGGKQLVTPIGSNSECAFIVGCKDTFDVDPWAYESGAIGSYNKILQTRRWSSGERRKWLNTVFREAIASSTFRGLFKEHINKESYTNPDTHQITVYDLNDYFSFASMYEILGTLSYGEARQSECGDIQFDYYKTPANRLKHLLTPEYSNQTLSYWTRAIQYDSAYSFIYITESGGAYKRDCAAVYGISPFGVI